MNNFKVDPYELDWGDVFVESYNTETKDATLIYNFNFDSISLNENILTYSIAHILWVYKNLPQGSSITAVYDVRKKGLSANTLTEFEGKIRAHLSHLNMALKVDFLFHR